jgi:hypothetical protein
MTFRLLLSSFDIYCSILTLSLEFLALNFEPSNLICSNEASFNVSSTLTVYLKQS